MLSKSLVLLAICVATSAQVTELPPIPADLSTPVQVRLAFNGPTGKRLYSTRNLYELTRCCTGMAIGWNTFQKIDAPTVRWGLVPGALVRSASSSSANSVTYPTSRV